MMPAVDIKRDLFLSLAQEMCDAAAAELGSINRRLKETGYQLQPRDRVLAGFVLKIESSFRSLMDDARTARGEAMHHLKTMVESLLYFHLVLDDPSDARARQVLAEVCYQKQKFISANPEYAVGDNADAWASLLAEYEREGITRIKAKASLKTLIEYSPGLKSWYKVYEAACEPAHISDLVDFMPDLDEPRLEIGVELSAGARARFAIDYGLAVMLAMLRAVLDSNTIALRMDWLAGFEARWQEIRSGKRLQLHPPDEEGPREVGA